MVEWSINLVKQLVISSKFMAFVGVFPQLLRGWGSSKTSSKSKLNLERGVWGVDGVAGSQDVALTADDSENRLRHFFDAEFLLLVASLCDLRRPLTS